jgi:hypothetical protein
MFPYLYDLLLQGAAAEQHSNPPHVFMAVEFIIEYTIYIYIYIYIILRVGESTPLDHTTVQIMTASLYYCIPVQYSMTSRDRLMTSPFLVSAICYRRQ